MYQHLLSVLLPPDKYPVGHNNALQRWWARTKWNHIQRSEIGIFQFGASTEYISQPRMGRLWTCHRQIAPRDIYLEYTVNVHLYLQCTHVFTVYNRPERLIYCIIREACRLCPCLTLVTHRGRHPTKTAYGYIISWKFRSACSVVYRTSSTPCLSSFLRGPVLFHSVRLTSVTYLQSRVLF
jgi:hypothetical protein